MMFEHFVLAIKELSICIHSGFQMLFTFILVCFGWIFFRANSLSDAWLVITQIFKLDIPSLSELFGILKSIFGTRAELYRLLLTLPVFLVASVLDYKCSIEKRVKTMPAILRYIVYVIIVVYVLLFARAEMQDFIYFQF